MSLVVAKFNGHPPPQERSCGGKKFYRNLFEALTAAHFVYKRHHDSLWPYRCFYCPGYHNGHVPRQVQVLINGIVGSCSRGKGESK